MGNPPHHPITFKPEGGVSQKNSKSKKGSEWFRMVQQKRISGEQREEGHGEVHHVQ